MLSASDTAYSLLKVSPSARELDELYTPTLFELRDRLRSIMRLPVERLRSVASQCTNRSRRCIRPVQ